METNSTYPIELITSYLAGEATGDDLIFLEAWLKADPGNVKIFEEFRKTWLELEGTKLDGLMDIDKEWKAMQFKLDAVEGAGNRERSNKRLVIRYLVVGRVWRIAAVILVLLIPSFFILRSITKPVQQQLEANLTITNGTLPDGTSVTLNKGAVLEYPSSFRGNKRSVRLRGEAWFEVKHDNAKPFIILSGNVKVEVLGTTFSVNTKAADNKMEVILNSGSLAVYFDDRETNRIILSPGEKAEINPEEGKMVKDINTDPNYKAWMTRHFTYNSEPLVNIVAGLNKVYHSDLRITTPGISYCLVTATFDHQSLESVLQVLQATLDLHIMNHGTWIEISGKKCN